MAQPDEPLTLYWHPRTRSTRARWMLEELGVPHEQQLVELRKGEHKQAAHRSLHPLGKVPVLKHGDQVVFESVAICLYLADRFPDAGLAPSIDDPLRGTYYQWMAFSVGTLEPAMFAATRRKGEPVGVQGSEISEIVELFESTLCDRMYLLGENFSAADVLNGSIMAWAQSEGLVPEGSAVDRWIQLLKDRPAYQRAVS